MQSLAYRAAIPLGRGWLRFGRCAASSQLSCGEASSVAMDLVRMLDELKNERALLKRSILVLVRLAGGHPKPRGRPPRWLTDLKQKPRGRRKGSKNKPKGSASVA